jgi:hypothetical protein
MPGVVFDHGTHYTDDQVTWETPDPPTGNAGHHATEPRLTNAPAAAASAGSRAAGEQKQDPYRW